MENQVNGMVKELKNTNLEYIATLFSALKDEQSTAMVDAAEAHNRGDIEKEMRCKAYEKGISYSMDMLSYAVTSYQRNTAFLYQAISEACDRADGEETNNAQ